MAQRQGVPRPVGASTLCLSILASTRLPAPSSSFVAPSLPRRDGPAAASFFHFGSRAGGSPISSPAAGRTAATELFLAKPSAKKKKKKSKAGVGGGGGGFGAAPPEKKPAKDYDYSVFPALEDGVRETLIPVPVGENTVGGYGGPMDGSIYDRIDQIYGFPRFNYEEGEGDGDDEEGAEEGGGGVEESVVSFDDLIGGSSPAPAPLSSSSLDFGDLLGSGSGSTGKPAFGAAASGGSSGDDLSDLIASATGGGGSSAAAAPAPAPAPLPAVAKLNLSSLPPFSNIRVLHVDPCVLAVDDFFSPEECDAYVFLSSSSSEDDDATLETRSKTVGKDSRAKAQRTSTTWFHNYRAVPELMAKASRLLGVEGIDRWEEPQTVRYRKTEKFTWHLDALAPSDDLSAKGGQRVATLLVYLTDLSEEEGGATMFRDLTGPDGQSPLKMRPKKGSALLFFPAAGGVPRVPFDVRTLHAGEAVSEESEGADKWIAQLWLREGRGYAPTAPPGNNHADAADAINAYCAAA